MGYSDVCAFAVGENIDVIKDPLIFAFLFNMTQLDGRERLASTFHF